MSTIHEILHLVTQRNQPYGSVRKCCERCGRAIWLIHWTDDESLYDEPPDGYVNCREASRQEKLVSEVMEDD